MLPRRPTILFLAFLLLLLFLPSSTSVAPRLHPVAVERRALLRIKLSDPDGAFRPWPAGADHCSWPGISCDAQSRVVAVNVSVDGARSRPAGASLSGGLSSAFGTLSRLRVLSFQCHGFSGRIPGSIFRLRHLQVMDLSGGALVGLLPRRFPCALRVLNLASNLLEGEIPRSLAADCSELEILNLSHNRLTGNVPVFASSSCRHLRLLDLSSNNLSGQVPASLSDCPQLQSLQLSVNRLHGVIPPELGKLTNLKVLDVSMNRLTGPLPAELGNCSDMSVLVLSSQFAGEFNLFEGGIPEAITSLPKLRLLWSLETLPRRVALGSMKDSTSNPSPSSGSVGFSSIEIASITSASAIVAVLLVLLVLYIYNRKCSRRRHSRPPARRREVVVFDESLAGLTYENVVRATGNFNASNCIGSGGFGATYKAEIFPGVLVAIKRLAVGRFQGVQQFHAEVRTLSRCRHPNLVTLIGYHFGDAEMFLVYNFLPGGNLERFIEERPKKPMNWKMLHKIALDVAHALAYLHDRCVPRILHRDVKPSNILLDNDFNAYLSDFGLARLLGNSETHATTGVAGTFGYVAPEYAMTCRVSDKADVYSYGVVLLELISDKKVFDPSFSPYGNGFNIVAWAHMLLQKGRAREFFVDGLWDAAPHDDLVEVLHLGIKCTVDLLSSRPTIKQVVLRLRELRPPNY